MNSAQIWKRIEDPRQPPILIAEIGINPCGRVSLAKKMIHEAARSGADLVKFQIYRTAEFLNPSYDLYSLFTQWEFSDAAVRELASFSRGEHIPFFATPFDPPSASLLAGLGVPGFKIASGDITCVPLLRAAARFGKWMILSTGASTVSEIQKAIMTVRRAGTRRIAALHCVSAYPAGPALLNLRAIPVLRKKLGIPIGFSDHSPGIDSALAAAALGARVIEKHFTIDRRLDGGDNAMSILPEECFRLSVGLKTVIKSIGSAEKIVHPEERRIQRPTRRGIYLRRAIPSGARLKESDLVALRPEIGIAARDWDRVVGKRLRRSLPAHSPVRRSDILR